VEASRFPNKSHTCRLSQVYFVSLKKQRDKFQTLDLCLHQLWMSTHFIRKCAKS
jgi:hypothetical protein